MKSTIKTSLICLALLAAFGAKSAMAEKYTMYVPAKGVIVSQEPTEPLVPGTPTDFAYSGKIDTYVVPTSGKYILEAYGGQGGYRSNYSSGTGFGAVMKCAVTLQAGTTLKILVGGAGVTTAFYAGAAGGTFIATSNNVPLVVAGGGGGGAAYYGGYPGVATNTGDTGPGTSAGFNNGAGFLGDSATAKSFVNGGASPQGTGGFGGGGGYQGGGGGYSGGGSDAKNISGKGGTSFCSGELLEGVTGGWGNPQEWQPVWNGRASVKKQ